MPEQKPESIRVAFQGEAGAFSQIAARQLLGDEVETVACPTFESLFSAIPEGRADLALAPLENTLAGPVLRCYDLLYQNDFYIRDETVLRISHCVIGFPNSSIDKLRRIQSHPVALAQCEKFFAEHPSIEKVVADDTAGSVRLMMSEGDPSVGAIASEYAAKQYGAEVLACGVEDDPQNFTRFALLSPNRDVSSNADACSIVITIANTPGGLYRSLESFAKHDINVISLVSRPLMGTPWHYRFFLDLGVPIGDPRMRSALDDLSRKTVELRVLGSYRTGR